MERWISVAGAVVVALAIGACSSAEDAETAPPIAGSSPPALSAGIVQERVDVAGGFVRIAVTNESDADVVVARAEYRSNQLVEPLVVEDAATIPASTTRALRGLLPMPTCDREQIVDEIVVTLDDGTDVTLGPSDPYRQIPTLTDAACTRLAVAEIADVTVEAVIPDDPGTPDAPTPAGFRITATPTGEGEVTLVDVDATPLLSLVGADGTRATTLPIGIVVAPGAPTQEIVIPAIPGRCDAHAIAEDKQGTLLRVGVLVDGEERTLLLPSSDDDRAALLQYVADACDLG